MLTEAAIRHFGSVRKVADALEISVQAVYQWGDLVPPLQAAKLDKITSGSLLFDPAQYDTWNRSSKATSVA